MKLWPGIGKVVDEIAPGVYTDEMGNVHFDVREMLKYLGSEDTPENRRTVARRLCAELPAGAKP